MTRTVDIGDDDDYRLDDCRFLSVCMTALDESAGHKSNNIYSRREKKTRRCGEHAAPVESHSSFRTDTVRTAALLRYISFIPFLSFDIYLSQL